MLSDRCVVHTRMCSTCDWKSFHSLISDWESSPSKALVLKPPTVCITSTGVTVMIWIDLCLWLIDNFTVCSHWCSSLMNIIIVGAHAQPHQEINTAWSVHMTGDSHACSNFHFKIPFIHLISLVHWRAACYESAAALPGSSGSFLSFYATPASQQTGWPPDSLICAT